MSKLPFVILVLALAACTPSTDYSDLANNPEKFLELSQMLVEQNIAFRSTHNLDGMPMQKAVDVLVNEGFVCKPDKTSHGDVVDPYIGCKRAQHSAACARNIVVLFPDWGGQKPDVYRIHSTQVKHFSFYCVPSA